MMGWATAVGLMILSPDPALNTRLPLQSPHRITNKPHFPYICTSHIHGRNFDLKVIDSEKRNAKGTGIFGGSKNWVSVIWLVASFNSCWDIGHCLAVDGDALAVGFPWERSRTEQAEPERGSCPTCIGVVDETLGSCSAVTNCVSSFDDRFAFFIAPWEFPGKLSNAVDALRKTLLSEGATVKEQEERYLHAVFISKDGTADDLEFLFSSPSADAIVNLRSASRAKDTRDYGRNRKRLDELRQALGWEEVPIVRNRQRKFFFLESPWDTFGPEPPPVYDFKGGLEVPD